MDAALIPQISFPLPHVIKAALMALVKLPDQLLKDYADASVPNRVHRLHKNAVVTLQTVLTCLIRHFDLREQRLITFYGKLRLNTTLDDIHKETGLAKSTIETTLGALKKAGYLEVGKQIIKYNDHGQIAEVSSVKRCLTKSFWHLLALDSQIEWESMKRNASAVRQKVVQIFKKIAASAPAHAPAPAPISPPLTPEQQQQRDELHRMMQRRRAAQWQTK